MLKQEEKQTMKAVQLTERDSNSIWKTKEGNKVLMSDMSEYQLQGALVIVQKRKLRSLELLLMDVRLEEQLMKEASNRNFPIQNLDEVKETHLARKFSEMQELMKTITTSIKRKVKLLSNEKINN